MAVTVTAATSGNTLGTADAVGAGITEPGVSGDGAAGVTGVGIAADLPNDWPTCSSRDVG